MASQPVICAQPCSFEIDSQGRLALHLADPTACNPGRWVCDNTLGLRYENVVPSLSLTMGSGVEKNTASAQPTWNNDDFTTTAFDDGSALGTWTINGDNSVTVHCTGVYSAHLWAGLTDKSGARVTGLNSRIFIGGNIFSSADIADFGPVTTDDDLDFAKDADGSELSCGAARRIAAGSVLSWRFLTRTLGNTDSIAVGVFDLAYLGQSV